MKDKWLLIASVFLFFLACAITAWVVYGLGL